MPRPFLFACAVACAAAAGGASAAPVTPVSYDMPNGYTGSYTYFDSLYSGSGNKSASGAALTGGLGELTDGVIAAANWNVVEAPSGDGPYVGWTINPTIVFRFAQAQIFDSVTFHLDDSNGAGGVSAPASITVNGVTKSVTDPAGSAPFAFTFDLGGLQTDTLTTTLTRKSSWVFLSEVTFDARTSAVPVPAGALMLVTALAGLGMARRRR